MGDYQLFKDSDHQNSNLFGRAYVTLQKLRFNPRADQMVFMVDMVDEVVLVQVFLRALRLCPVNNVPQMPINNPQSTAGWQRFPETLV